MAKPRIAELIKDKPLKVTVDLPASVHRDLVAYAEILAAQTGQSISEPNKLIQLMLARFMATDRVYTRIVRNSPRTQVSAMRFEVRQSAPSMSFECRGKRTMSSV